MFFVAKLVGISWYLLDISFKSHLPYSNYRINEKNYHISIFLIKEL